MAGTYTTSHAAQGWTARRRAPVGGSHRLPPARGYVQMVGRSDLLTTGPGGRKEAPLAGLGQAAAQEGLSTGAYATASLLGAGAGGAIIGLVAAGDGQGAVTGGAFAGGMTAIADAFVFGRAGNAPGAALMGLLGLGTVGWALTRFTRTVRRRST